MRRLDGEYRFEPDGDATHVVYELEVDLIIPLPGFVKRRAEHKIMHTALDELRAHVERTPRVVRPVRILLFTGKGGVGKTTTAAATALACADRGARTLVVSTDPAHSLGDAFGVELGDQPGPVDGVGAASGLWGQQLDATARMEESWGEIQAWLQEVFAWAGIDAIEAEELAVLPGLDEIFALADIKAHAVVRRLGRARRRLRPDGGDDPAPQPSRHPQLVHGAAVPGGPAGQQDGVAGARAADEPAGGRRRGLRRRPPLLRPPRRGEGAAHRPRTSRPCAWSSTPSAMVIAEARRTYTYLSLFGYRVDCVVANRLLPEEITDPWFDRWRDAARRAPGRDRGGLRPAAGAQGRAGRRRAGRRSPPCAASPPACTARTTRRRVATGASPSRSSRAATVTQLVLELPFADHDDLDLGRRGRRAARAGRALPPGDRAARLPQAPHRHRGHPPGWRPARRVLGYAMMTT